ncbi:ABC transporter permease [Arthrospiribacter ruber]|uniref:ABC transporter permease n=1 Tax=Arthrospiribacter ruber TaxID=2487934 RepID=A0A951IYR9_9BACT|nr:ABC transporter permease [Arthrospiribacter ruber]MBW3468023.1 ABC transporter permease [Arthrospiribacter ruber]
MFTNYFKIALRGFAKHKLTFFINLFGLTLGLWATISIGLWVKSELNTNQHFPEIDQVYRVMEHQRYGSDIFTTTSTPGILAQALKNEYPEVELAACYSWNQQELFLVDDQKANLSGFFAEPDYLHIMQYDFLHGDRSTALTEISHIVLSKESAIKLFGKTDVIGETVTLKETDGESNFKVMGVLDFDKLESSGSFDYILPFQFMFDKPYNGWLNSWGNNGPSTIVKLNKNSDWKNFSTGIEDFIAERNEGSNVKLFVYPQKDLYLKGRFEDGKQAGGRIEYVRLFAIIGLFVLLIACINFMNLSTAKSQKRAKEVGVRKVVGADKGMLVSQFLTESLVITFFAGVFSILLVELTLPIFNNLTGKAMSVPYGELISWLQFALILLVTGVIAGSYPAFYLSATKVVQVFRSYTKSGKGVAIARKGLVLFQFILATMLIVATMVVYKQINFALNKDLGYNKDQLINLTLEGKMMENFEAFKNDLETVPGVLAISRSTHSLLGRNSNSGGISWEGKDPEFSALFEIMRVDYDFIETMGFKIIHGEDFSEERVSDSLNKAILNRRAYELITESNPEASSFTWDTEIEILGVVEDFHFQSFHQGMEPVIILLDPSFANRGYIKVQPENMQETLTSIQQVANTFEPSFPFQYSFMDENYARMYQEDVRVRELAKYFSILTILISCLGLLGLSSHIAEQKTKEIGIRKVLGASTLSILHVINKEFIAVVALSILIGSGIAYWLMQDWLNDYAYSIDFEWWFIPLAASVILTIAYLTVSLQALKAAQINPVSTLKSE